MLVFAGGEIYTGVLNERRNLKYVKPRVVSLPLVI